MQKRSNKFSFANLLHSKGSRSPLHNSSLHASQDFSHGEQSTSLNGASKKQHQLGEYSLMSSAGGVTAGDYLKQLTASA
jgi:hypothetical protein